MKRPGRTSQGQAERQIGWPSIKRLGRTSPRGPKYIGRGTNLPRHKPFVILYAGTYWPRYKAGEGKAEAGHTLAGGQRCCHVTAITGRCSPLPMPWVLDHDDRSAWLQSLPTRYGGSRRGQSGGDQGVWAKPRGTSGWACLVISVARGFLPL